VLGGTGLLGYTTIRELIRRGYEVTSLALPPLPVEGLFDDLDGVVDSHLGDLNDLGDDEVLDLLRGHRAVMYAAGADERVTPPAPAARFFYEANVLPTQRLAALARTAGVQSFVVYGSYFAEFAERMPELGLRDHGYPVMRLLQEQVAFAEGDGAMTVTSLRLPYIFGTMPGRMPLWSMFVEQIRGREVFPAHEGGITAAVTTRQVAQAAVGAMERGEHRHTYPLGGYNLEHAAFYRRIAERLQQSTQVPLVPFEALEPTLAELDEQCAQQGVEHGIHLRVSGYLRSLDLSLDPVPAQSALGYEDDDVPAAIERTLDVVLAADEDSPA
ncbi:MAG: NAD-dependent epimerase/dehydratase family protein, partial [Brachybacterium sp.]|nr:NAD-dependent epimerase/dehydratase family protein [Brachybacterium sp.]